VKTISLVGLAALFLFKMPMNRIIFLSSEKIEARQTQPNVQGVEFLLHPHNFTRTE